MSNPYAPPPTSGPPRQAGRGAEDPSRERQRPWPGGGPPEPTPPPERGRRGHGQRRRRPTPEEVRTASRRALATTGFTFGALVASALPLPWPAIAGVLSLVAVVTGIRALRTVWLLGLRRSLMPVVSVSLALAAIYLVSSIGVVITWPIHQERQDCLDRALTVSARDVCETEFREALQGFSPGAP